MCSRRVSVPTFKQRQNLDSPSLNSCRSLGFTKSGLTVSNHQKSSAMNTIKFCCVRNSEQVSHLP